MKMKVLFSVLFIGSSLLSLTSAQSQAQAQADEKYSRRYDNIDINNIFRSRLLNHYVDCLLDKKPCPPEGKELKQVLPDALKTRCGRCTKVQKEKALDVVTRLYYQHPSLYTALAERYDPTGEYTKNFERWFDQQNALKGSPQSNQNTRNEGNQFVTRPALTVTRRSSGGQETFNELPTEKTRIPSTWITTTVRTTTTTRATTTRAPLRTLPPTVKPQVLFRETTRTPSTQPTIFRPTESRQIVQQFTTTLRPPTTPPRRAFIDPQVGFRSSSATIDAFNDQNRPETFTRPPISLPPRNVNPTIVNVPTLQNIPNQPSIRVQTNAPSVFREVVTQRTTVADVPRTSFVSNEVVSRQPSRPVQDEQFAFQAPIPRTEQARPPVATRPQLLPVDLPPTRPQVNFRPETPLESRVADFPRTNQDQERVNQPTGSNFQPLSLIDNFFIPNGNNQFRRSIEGLWDTTGKVVSNVAEMFRSTVEVITGTR